MKNKKKLLSTITVAAVLLTIFSPKTSSETPSEPPATQIVQESNSSESYEISRNSENMAEPDETIPDETIFSLEASTSEPQEEKMVPDISKATDNTKISENASVEPDFPQETSHENGAEKDDTTFEGTQNAETNPDQNMTALPTEAPDNYTTETNASDSIPETRQSDNTSNGNRSNFNTYDNPEQQNTNELVLNTNTKKIHHSWCGSVATISPENYATSSLSVEELEAQGYTKCGKNGDW